VHAGQKATDKHSEYVILIALPQQQWLHERNAPQCYVIRKVTVLFASLYT